jgi:hypothetical protein
MSGTAYNVSNAKIHLRQIVILLKDPKLWCWTVTNAGFALATASIGSFLPTFIKEFGFSPSIHTRPLLLEIRRASRLINSSTHATFYCHSVCSSDGFLACY